MMNLKKITRREAGFTLLELLVVLAIMGLLAAIIAPQVLKYLGTSRTQTARVQIQNITSALEYCTSWMWGGIQRRSEGLNALVTAPPSSAGVERSLSTQGKRAARSVGRTLSIQGARTARRGRRLHVGIGQG
jgi:prepilin-type N-terminal cleavage/methylation domain-containing protein